MKLVLALCGRMHDGEKIQVLENLRGVTGPAEYGKPQIQQILQVECDSAPNGGLFGWAHLVSTPPGVGRHKNVEGLAGI